MKSLLIVAALISLNSYASEEVKCTEALSGDTLVCTFYRGGLKLVHLAGIDAPEEGQEGFDAAKSQLNALIKNKNIRIVPIKTEKEQVIARAYNPDDLSSELLKKCLVFLREENGLSSVQLSSFKIHENKCRHSKIGIFRNGRHYFARPSDYRKSGLNEMKQPYINGTKDPKANDLNRPIN